MQNNVQTLGLQEYFSFSEFRKGLKIIQLTFIALNVQGFY